MSRTPTPHKRSSRAKKRKPPKRKAVKKPAKKPTKKPAKPAKKKRPARQPSAKKKPARKRAAPAKPAPKSPPPAGFREVSGVRDMLEQLPLPFAKEERRQRVIDLAFDSGFRTEALPNSEDLYDYMAWFAEELDLEIYDVYAMYYGYSSNSEDM